MNVELALLTAIRAHAGQRYGQSRAYMEHVLDVTSRVLNHEEEVIIAAILHDTVEDTEITLDEIGALFGPRVRASVDALTKRNHFQTGETYAEYIDRLSKNPDAVTVKFADLEANLEANPHETLRMRYEAAWESLHNVKYPADGFDHGGTP